MRSPREHTWVRQEQSLVVYVDLPAPGAQLTQDMPFGRSSPRRW